MARQVWLIGSVRSPTAACPWLLGKEESYGSNGKQHPDDGEGIAEAHDQRLSLDDPSKRDHGLLRGCCVIRNAVRQEVGGRLIETLADLVARQGNRLADDVGMELLAFGQHSSKG